MIRDIPLEYINNPYHPVGGEAQDVYVKDLNGDGIIDDDDKTILGDPYPDFVWSISNEFKIGAIRFKHLCSKVAMEQRFEIWEINIYLTISIAHKIMIQQQRLDQEFIREKIFTDDIIQDASYIALTKCERRLCTLPNKLISKMFLTKARVICLVEPIYCTSLQVITQGFNPESINNTSPTTYGYQRAGSPINQTITVGLNLEF